MMGDMNRRPNPRRKSRVAALCLTVISLVGPVLLPAGTARADDLVAKNDARLEGYPRKVALDGSTAPSYLLLTALGIVCFVVMFKDAKRTHLD
jgi:hypothetical protein